MPRGLSGRNKLGCFFGDSITKGTIPTRVTEAEAIPYLVSSSKLYAFVNSGIGGDTSTDGLARFESTCLAHGPSMVSIGFGTNDPGSGINTTVFSANITEMVRKAKIAGARVTLWVPIYAQSSVLDDSIAPYRTVMRSLASSLSCDLFDLYDDIVALDATTQNSYYNEEPDEGQHFSPAGHAWAAAKVGSGAYANSFLSSI